MELEHLTQEGAGMREDTLPVVAGPGDNMTWQAGLLDSRYTYQGQEYRICECRGALFDGARAWIAESETLVALTLHGDAVYVYIRSSKIPSQFNLDPQASREVTAKVKEDQNDGDSGRKPRRRRRK